MPAKVVHGARAQLIVGDINNSDARVVGVFNNVSLGLNYDVAPIYTLGNYAPQELVYTAQEAVNVEAAGFRVVDHGAQVDGKVPRLQDLINHEYISLAIQDRQTGRTLYKIRDVRPVGYNTSMAARDVESMTIRFTGRLIDEDNVSNDDTVGGVLPPTRLP